jgi:hypothetical protein
MSFQAMTWATEQELPAMQKIVLLMMANRTNHDTGLCFPSHDLLAKECGMAKRSLIDQINKLEAAGLVEVIRSVNEKSMKNVNRYRLNLHVKATGKEKQELNEIGSAGDALYSAGNALGSAGAALGGSAGAAHKPVIIEPVKEPIQNTSGCAQAQDEGESFSDDQVLEAPLEWAQFFIRECQYPLHIVQTSKTIPLFAQWVADKTTVGEVRQAMAACHGWNHGRVPDSPTCYGKFLQSVRDVKKQMADEATFAARPGAGRSRQQLEEWAKIPRDDEQLWSWAKKHGYPEPGSMTYRQYRSRLQVAVDARLSQAAASHG